MLTALYVSNNALLAWVDNLAFANLPRLESLYLNINIITELSTAALSPLVNLKTLSLRNTKLQQLPILPSIPLTNLFFDRVPGATLSRAALANVAPTLQFFSARINNRSYGVAPDLFQDCTQLLTVDLSRNMPLVVPDNFFGAAIDSISSITIDVRCWRVDLFAGC